MQPTPIDIHCGKLVDWLVQHRHCRKDWGENLASIRRKIKAALKDMPESEDIKTLLIGSKLDYFKSKRIVAILKTTEADSKNIFGYYSSQRMKDWQDIVSSYERDYVYLAEIATDLIRETNYEVPGIRKVIQKLQRERDDAEKEKANVLRRVQLANAEHQRLAQAYGIKGENVIAELNEQTRNLTKVMNEMVGLASSLEPGLEFYRDFASSTTRQDATKFLPTLNHIVFKGNTTVYEWRTNEVPNRVVVADKVPASSGTNPSPSDMELVDDEIDFGDDDAPPASSSESSSGFVHLSNNEDTFVQVEDVCDSNQEKVARGDDAKLVLEFRKSRNQFLNNLFELDAFFKQMVSEGQTDSTRLDTKGMNQQICTIRQIVELVNKEKNRVLFQMSDSPSFIGSVNERFSAKVKQALDCNIKASQISERIEDIQARIRDTEMHLKRSIAAAKELREKVEQSISELYKGRHINIMGCVN